MKRIRGIYSKYSPNKSCKDLYFSGMIGVGTKPAIWGWSNEKLRDASAATGQRGNIYDKELNRRAKNAAKRKTPRPGADMTNAVAPDPKYVKAK